MMISSGYNSRWDNPEPESYSSYKKRKFNKYSEKINLLLKGIDSTSLKDRDKKYLLKTLKSKVNNFNL